MTKISILYNKPIDKLLLKLKALLKKEDYFVGSQEEGMFKIKSSIGIFQGKYTVKNNLITIDITNKPLFINSKIIENQIKKYLSNN